MMDFREKIAIALAALRSPKIVPARQKGLVIECGLLRQGTGALAKEEKGSSSVRCDCLH
jgi:hypothetical protein